MEVILRRAANAGVRRAAAWPLAAAVAGWALVVAAGHLLGDALVARDPLVHIGAAPLVGSLDLRLSARVLPALALGAAAVAWAPVLAARLRWRGLLATSWVAALGWALALAATDGWDAIAAPLRSRYEQLTAVGEPTTSLPTPSSSTATCATAPPSRPRCTASIMFATRPRWSASGPTSATSPTTPPTTTSEPPSCCASLQARASAAGSCSRRAWSSTARDATRVPSTASSCRRRGAR